MGAEVTNRRGRWSNRPRRGTGSSSC